MSEKFDAICPIFVEYFDQRKTEQIGSGVLLEIEKYVFLLTAAHVADIQSQGDLLIPAARGLTEIYGQFAHVAVPHGTKRADDKIDIAYFRLDQNLVSELHPSLRPLKRDELYLTDNLLEGDIYTFAGYPWRKSKVFRSTASTELFLFTGAAASEKKFSLLGYEPRLHVLIKFYRKNVITNGKICTAPMPHGISGGAVFRRPKDLLINFREDKLDLVAIAHSFHEKQKCMAGTDINAYIACIFRNNPQLLPKQVDTYHGPSIPMFMSIVWYRQEDWARIKQEFDDGHKMHETWEEWRQATEHGIEYMARREKIMTPVELTTDEIADYCRREKLPNTSSTRTHLAGIKMAEWFFEKEIKPKRDRS